MATTVACIGLAGVVAYFVVLPFPLLASMCGYLIGAGGLGGAVMSIFTPRRLPQGRRILYAAGSLFVAIVSLGLAMGAFPN